MVSIARADSKPASGTASKVIPSMVSIALAQSIQFTKGRSEVIQARSPLHLKTALSALRPLP